jgi:hypothetical protein
MKQIDVMHRETVGIMLMFSGLFGWIEGELLAGGTALDFIGVSLFVGAVMGINWSRVFGRLVGGIEDRGAALSLHALTRDVHVPIADVVGLSVMGWRADFVSVTLDVRTGAAIESFIAPGVGRAEAKELAAFLISRRAGLVRSRGLSLRDRSLWTSSATLALSQGAAFSAALAFTAGATALAGAVLGVLGGVAVAVLIRLLSSNELGRRSRVDA